MKDEIEFAGASPLAKNLIFIDGITRSGKFWLANLLNHLSAVEQFRQDPSMDHIAVISHFNLVKEDAAISLLQDMVNSHVFETAIGRNINFRYADSSSIFKNPNLQNYLIRVFGANTDPRKVFDELKSDYRYFVFITHDWLSHLSIQLKAFPEMKLIRIERNPIDLAYAWYTTGIGRNRMFFSQRVKGIKGSVPWFAHNWLDDFEEMGEMDRTIKSILLLDPTARSAFESLPSDQQSKILFTSFESLAGYPMDTAEKIAEFIKTKVNDSIQAFISQPAFMKKTSMRIKEARKEKLLFIKDCASPNLFSLIKKAGEDYEEFWEEK